MPRATRPPLSLLLVFGGLCAAYLCMAGMAPDAKAAKRKPLSLKLAVPSAGDVTLARSFFEVRATKGKRLPKRLRFKTGVRNSKKLPRTVDAFFTAVKVKSKKTSKNRARYAALVVVTRRKGTASTSQNAEDKQDFADLFWAQAVVGHGAGPVMDYIDKRRRDRQQKNAFAGLSSSTSISPLCIENVANFDTFPSVESLLGSAASEPVAEVMAKRTSPRQNLRYAFAAGCRIKTIPVPTSWFAERGLINPTLAGGGGGGGGQLPASFTCNGQAIATHASGAPQYDVGASFACSGGSVTGVELTFSKVPTSADVVFPAGSSCQVGPVGDGSGRGRATCTFPQAVTSASPGAKFPDDPGCPAATGVELVVFTANGRAGPFLLPREHADYGPDCS